MIPKPKRKTDEAFLDIIRRMPCALVIKAATHCEGPTDPAHVRSRGAGGGDVGNVIPLCRKHHREQHQVGIKTFEARHGTGEEKEGWMARLAQELASIMRGGEADGE